jgi:hypothetical protein
MRDTTVHVWFVPRLIFWPLEGIAAVKMEEVRISRRTMQRVLEGIAVATKAPECLVQHVSDLIIQRDPTSKYESGPDPESHTTDPPTTGPSFRDWSDVFEYAPEHHFEGPITPLN